MLKHGKFMAAMVVSAHLCLPAGAEDAGTVAATVNGTDITVGHMVMLRRSLPAQYQSLPDDVLFEGLLQQLIQDLVLLQSLNGEVPEPTKLSIENEIRKILAAKAVERAVDGAVTEEAIQAAYDETYADTTPQTEYNASHILVETEDEAKALINQLNDGADFAELAVEHSTGPSGPGGGNLGWFGPGAMVPPFEEAVVALEVGAVSEPVKTQFGWHVVTLNETREKPAPTLEETRAQLIAGIEQRVAREAVQALIDAAEIARAEEGEIDPSILSDPDILAD